MQFAPWRTLRGRLVLSALVIEAVMLTALVGNSLRLVREEMGDQSREQAEQIAPVLSAALAAPMAQFDYATVQAVLDESQAVRGIDYLAVANSSGVIVATSGLPNNAALPRIDASFNLDDDPPRYDLALPIRLSGQTLGTLQFGLDLKRIVVARKNLLSQGVLIAVSELLLSAGLLTLLGMLITRQLSLLTEVSHTVAQGQLSPGLVPEGQDDVGRLGAAFNAMSRSIAERVAQLTVANLATAQMASELQEKNVQLEHNQKVLRLENAMRLSAQNELEDALARIREHTEQLNAIFNLTPDGIVSFDTNKRVKYASPAFLSLTGIMLEEIVGSDEATFSRRLAQVCADPARFPGLAAIKADARRAGEPAQALASRRLLIDLASPGKHVLEVGVSLSEAEAVSKIFYFRDVTRETEVDRLKSEFLSHAAHELRTPMASIYGYAEILKHEDYPPEERQEFLDIIYRQSELMIAIINELLDLVRIEERRGKDFEFARVNLGELVTEVVNDFGLPNGHQPAQLDVTTDACRVRADPKKLKQAVRNILSNAYKYSPAKGSILVCLIKEPRDSQLPDQQARVGIRVVDQGIGMTAEQTTHVCERFYRADHSGNIPGTGLGMSIVKELVELHGGEVAIESALGQGTTVTLWLALVA